MGNFTSCCETIDYNKIRTQNEEIRKLLKEVESDKQQLEIKNEQIKQEEEKVKNMTIQIDDLNNKKTNLEQQIIQKNQQITLNLSKKDENIEKLKDRINLIEQKKAEIENIKQINTKITTLIKPSNDHIQQVAQNLENFELSDIEDNQLGHIDIINKATNLKSLKLSWILPKEVEDDKHLNDIKLASSLTSLQFNMKEQKFTKEALTIFSQELNKLDNLQVLQLDLEKMPCLQNDICEKIFECITKLTALTTLKLNINSVESWKIQNNYQILSNHLKDNIWKEITDLSIDLSTHNIPKKGSEEILKKLEKIFELRKGAKIDNNQGNNIWNVRVTNKN